MVLQLILPLPLLILLLTLELTMSCWLPSMVQAAIKMTRPMRPSLFQVAILSLPLLISFKILPVIHWCLHSLQEAEGILSTGISETGRQQREQMFLMFIPIQED